MKAIVLTVIVSVMIVGVSISAVASERKTNLEADELVRKALVEHYETQCLFTLKCLGSCQLAYADANWDKNFGTWYSLQDGEWIDRRYSRTDIIEKYSICSFNVLISSYVNGRSRQDSKFAIAAVPWPDNHFGLRTFAISESHVTMEWIGTDIQWRNARMTPTWNWDSSIWAIVPYMFPDKY